MAWKSWTWTRSSADGDAVLVGRAVDDAALDAAAGEPGGEDLVMMLAAGVAGLLVVRGAAELGGPDDERVVEHAALLRSVIRPAIG